MERDPNGDVLELLATLGGTVPAHAGRYWPSSDPADVVAACTRDLDPETLSDFLEAFDGPWTLMLVCHDRHPSLDLIVAWIQAREHALLLATPSGPPIPAVAVFTRPSPELWDPELAAAIGVDFCRRLDDGRLLGVTREATHTKLWVGDKWGPSRAFEYPTPAAALAAGAEWTGDDDPADGWTRAYPPTFRRRPDGRPESEYEAP